MILPPVEYELSIEVSEELEISGIRGVVLVLPEQWFLEDPSASTTGSGVG